MAEGPVVHHYAKQLKKALQGKDVDVEFGVKKLKEHEASMKNIRVEKNARHGLGAVTPGGCPENDRSAAYCSSK